MRVVLLNDNRAERDSMVRVLRRASPVVEAFSDANGAVASITGEAPEVIVVAMSSYGGPELIRLLRGADVSGHAYLLAVIPGTLGGREILPALAAGAQDFIRRPVVDAELVERVKAPMRMLKWARSVTKPAVFDLSMATDIRGLRVWQIMGAVVAEDLSQMVGQPLETTKGWPKRFGRDVRCATIPMSLPSDQVELRVSVVIDAASVNWLGNALLGDPRPADAALDDLLRELANTAGGAVKRAALPENVTFTAGLPISGRAPHFQGADIQSFTLSADLGKACIAIVAEVRKRENLRVLACDLREGMVLVHDLRSRNGALLVTAGSRLTSTAAARVAMVLGERFVIEVSCAA
jgi:FixJ family two-component response regulator